MEVQERRDCGNCGAVLAGDARFCQRCGAPVATAPAIDPDDDRIDGARPHSDPERRSYLGGRIPETWVSWGVRIVLGTLVVVTAAAVLFAIAVLLFDAFVE